MPSRLATGSQEIEDASDQGPGRRNDQAAMLLARLIQPAYLATKPAKCSIVQPALRQPSIAPQRNEPGVVRDLIEML